MGHGTEGNGYTQFGQESPGNGKPDENLAAALERWAESGVAPDSIVARRHQVPSDTNSKVLGRRVLRAWSNTSDSLSH